MRLPWSSSQYMTSSGEGMDNSSEYCTYVHAYDGGTGSDYSDPQAGSGIGGGGGGAGLGSSTPDE